MIEWRLVKKYGRWFAEGRYVGQPWTEWYFPVSYEPKTYYIWEPSLNVYRRNTSI